MVAKRCVLSSVGTSLLTNRADRAQQAILRDAANLTRAQLDEVQRTLIDELALAAGQYLARATVAERRRAGAELNGLYGLLGERPGSGRLDMHFLLATDTAQGRAAAEVIAGLLRADGLACDVVVPPGLSTRSQAAFADGIRAVIRWCEETLPDYKAAGYQVIFNLVGSFKSLQGYLNTIGMFYADEIIYIFESPAAELIRIPRLPIRVDLQLLAEQRELFALLADALIVPAERLAGWPEALWEPDGQGSATLSAWGLLLWNQQKHELLSRNLLQLPGLVPTATFRREFDGHADAQERVKLQETLATVSHLLQENQLDTAALKRHPGLQYDNYAGRHANIGHFRVTRGLRVSCETSADGLVLHRFNREEEVNARPL
jgi:putative CRISPR-associated protein (TIGR02619 family)